MTKECTLELEEGVARLEGELTFESSPALYHAMEEHMEAGRPFERVDLSGVTSADSAGLALLLEWQASRRAGGSTLSMTGAPESLLQLARLSEAVDLLRLTGRGSA